MDIATPPHRILLFHDPCNSEDNFTRSLVSTSPDVREYHPECADCYQQILPRISGFSSGPFALLSSWIPKEQMDFQCLSVDHSRVAFPSFTVDQPATSVSQALLGCTGILSG